MPYETQPGTMPHRVVEWLKQQDVGAEASTPALCEALEVQPHLAKTLCSWLRPARQAGLLVAQTKPGHRRTLFWSLGDGTPQPGTTDDEDTPEEEAEMPEFNAALWADGDLVLVGVELNEDGHTVTLKPPQVRLLCRLLHGQGPEA